MLGCTFPFHVMDIAATSNFGYEPFRQIRRSGLLN
jgi:hypothetical protein